MKKRPQTSLRRPENADIGTPGRRRIGRVWIVAVWILLWLPLSLLMPSHADFPIPAFLMPAVFPLVLLQGGFSRFDLSHVLLPAAVFWGGMVVVLSLTRRLRGTSKADVRGGR
jgi:hypothetical protein